jgi:NhaP-type Na+/H+ or K+/H+ antiporter
MTRNMKKDDEQIPLKYRVKLWWERVRGYVGLAAVAAAAVFLPRSTDFTKMDPVLFWAVMVGGYIILGGLAILCIRDIKHSRNISNLILYDFKQPRKKDDE